MGSKNVLFYCSVLMLIICFNAILCDEQENEDDSDLLAMETQNVRLDYDNQV